MSPSRGSTRRFPCVAGSRCILVATMGILAAGFGSPARGQIDLSGPRRPVQTLEERVQARRLSNGIRVLVVERRQAPVVSVHTHVAVGAADDPPGLTGLAHLFEDLAYRGTTTIGSRDPGAEAGALVAVDDAWRELQAAVRDGAPPEVVQRLRDAFDAARATARTFEEPDEIARVYAAAGAIDLTARVDSDGSDFSVSLPANKLELWAVLESERLRDPVLRDFYTVLDHARDERALRVDRSPLGRLLESFLSTAFLSHAYGHPMIGRDADLARLNRARAREFFERYYVPANIVLALVGDVNAPETFELLERTFGRIPARPSPAPVLQAEPPQQGERRTVVTAGSLPMLLVGYHRPAAGDPEDAVWEALVDLLGVGQRSRLHQALVKEKGLATSITAFAAMPGRKHPCVMAFLVSPAEGIALGDVEAALLGEVERLGREGPTEEELARVRARALRGLYAQLRSNAGLAAGLARAEGAEGGWRGLFRRVERIDAVTAADVVRVAGTGLTESQRTVASIVPRGEGR